MNQSTDLAARLEAGALDHFERAAVDLLISAPYLLARTDVREYIDIHERAAAVRWQDLAHAVRIHMVPLSSGERRLAMLACSIASPQVQVALSEVLVGLDVEAAAAVARAIGTAVRHRPATPDVPPVYTVDFAAGVPHSHRPGMVAGLCGHAVAPSEWRVGIRYCERCTPIASGLTDLLPQLRPWEFPADLAGDPIDSGDLAQLVRDRITDLMDLTGLANEGDIEVTVALAHGEVTVHDADDEDLVLARGVITGPGVTQ